MFELACDRCVIEGLLVEGRCVIEGLLVEGLVVDMRSLRSQVSLEVHAVPVGRTPWTDDSSCILDKFGAGTLSILRVGALIVLLLSNACVDRRLSWWFLLLSERSMLFLPLAFLLDEFFVLKTDDSSCILDKFGAGTLSILRESALIITLMSNASVDRRLSWWFLLLSERL